MTKNDFLERNALFLPEISRFDYLVALPESADVGEAIDNAMKAIEDEYDTLKGVLPRNFSVFSPDLLRERIAQELGGVAVGGNTRRPQVRNGYFQRCHAGQVRCLLPDHDAFQPARARLHRGAHRPQRLASFQPEAALEHPGRRHRLQLRQRQLRHRPYQLLQ